MRHGWASSTEENSGFKTEKGAKDVEKVAAYPWANLANSRTGKARPG